MYPPPPLRFSWNLISTWRLIPFKLANSYIGLRDARLWHKRLCCLYFWLPNIPTHSTFNPLNAKLVYILFKNSVHTSKRIPIFIVTKINLLMPFKEIIAVYSEIHAKPINTKCSITDCQYRWIIRGVAIK
jgi:hypothetical protein